MQLPYMSTISKIPLADAIRFTARWRTTHPTAIRAFTTNIGEIRQIINKSDSPGTADGDKIRLYFAINDNNEETLVLVKVDENGRDEYAYPDSHGNMTSGTFDLLMPCPNTCDDQSPLNDNLKNSV
ncbi:MAG: hypothetical protein R2794_04655 [Chitinophagales bacterium]